MYEHLRNSVQVELSAYFKPEDMEKILTTLDRAAANYDITEKETALTVFDDEIHKLANIYLSSKKLEGLSDKTIEMYANRLRIFFDMVGRKPEEIETNEIRLFLVQYQQQHNVSDRTLDKFRQVLNSFFDWCLNEEYITKNPCRNIKEIKYEVEPRRSLTRFQLERVRRTCASKRDLAIVDVLYSTGCRVTELVNMKFSDVDFNENLIAIVGKGKKHNTVYLNTNAQISLNEYINDRKGNSEYLFTSERQPYDQLSSRTVERIFKELGEKLGYKLTPHILRHTSATLALQNGMEITQVQKMLGHASVNTTQIYAETSQEEVANSHRKYVI